MQISIIINKIKNNRELILNFILLFFSIILIVFLIELVSFIFIINDFSGIATRFEKEEQVISYNLDNIERIDDLGPVLKKNNYQRSYKSYLGKVIYDVIYSTDGYRRRTVHKKYTQNNSHIILFGDSNIFGVGLDDNETLQYMFNEILPGYNIYNYAVFGYGPQQMVVLLEKGNLPQEVKSNNGLAIYSLHTGHIYRAIGSTRTMWAFQYPYYYLDKNDTLQREGFIKTGRPIRTYIYSKFSKIKKRSNFLKLISSDLPLWISKNDVHLTSKIIIKAKELYEKQFNGTFYVLNHPFNGESRSFQSRKNDDLVKLLIKNNVTVLNYATVLSYPLVNLTHYEIQGDGHPNAKLNKLLASKLAKDLNKLEGNMDKE